jgi:hypothetical protein
MILSWNQEYTHKISPHPWFTKRGDFHDEIFIRLRRTKEDESRSGETPDLLLEGDYSPVVAKGGSPVKKVSSGEKGVGGIFR